VPAALHAAQALTAHGLSTAVVNSPVIKPLDAETILSVASGARLIISAENHSIIGGLGSAVAEALAEAGIGVPLRRIGLDDVFAESGSRDFLFQKYGLEVGNIVQTAWSALRKDTPAPKVREIESKPGTYAPV
ncbi:MAG: transketolase, partial [Gammaproteobacteria bacterium]|nr:transketolase [Gammaproteobacteria bacterium]